MQECGSLRRASRHGLRRSLLVVALAAAAGGAHAANAPALHALALAQAPDVVVSGQALRIAAMPRADRLKLAINLPLRDEAGLKTFLRDVQDPASPQYRHYLDVDTFTSRYAPTAADYDAVVAWAKAEGFTVTATARNRHLVDIEGTVDVVERALHVTINQYRHPTEGRTFRAPDREPTIDLAVPVLKITGLDDYQRPRPLLKASDASQAGPIVHAGGSGPGGQFLPSDMRAAYYGNGPLTGAGQTVGIFSFDGYKPDDIQMFFSHTGMSSTVPVDDVRVAGFNGLCGDGGDGCDDGEQILDIVNVIGMAPGLSQVLFYEGNSGPDILNRMATDNLAKVLSCSWGSGDMGPENDPVFLEFQAQGQTFANATGDDGSYDASAWLPPSLNPYTLQVGGTKLTTATPGGAWSAESAWSDSGGGYYAPAGYAIPTWQQLAGVITAANAGSTTLRNDPDVAAEGNFDNPTVSNGSFLTGYGGTSFAAPRWAGYIALLNEQATANGGGPIGFANPALYATGVGANAATNFHDVASGSNGGFTSVAGYDLVTGWGSPNAALVATMAGATGNPGYVLGLYPQVVYATPGSSVNTALTITAINGFSESLDFSTSGVPAGSSATVQSTGATSATVAFDVGAATALGSYDVVVDADSQATHAMQAAHLRLVVGDAPSATTDAEVVFDRVVQLGKRDAVLSIANAADSVPLTYSAVAHASHDGSCSGGVDWLDIPAADGSVDGGDSGAIGLVVQPALATLAPGSYDAEVCIATNDTAHAQIVVPVHLEVIAGPQSDTIFLSGFESGETGTVTQGVFTFDVDQEAEDSQAGSALDLATGNWHTWNATDIDNINPYDDGTGLQVYWYNDLLPASVRNKVGGVVVGGQYAVLQSGATIGPSSTFSRTVSPMTNWQPGADGYIGIAFYNSQTHALNYGYIHMTTTGPSGFPAHVYEIGFDNTGAAITIP